MKGLYNKYIVTKTNGHPLAEGFQAIVLRIDGGQYMDACRTGVLAFAKAVESLNPDLAFDIEAEIMGHIAREHQTQLDLDKREE